MSFLFIVNPAATRCPVGIESRIRAHFPDSRVWFTERGGDAGRLARRAVEEGVGSDDVLVSAGGDGTFREVASAAEGCIRMGVLPLGTVNLVALQLGVPLSLDGALESVERGASRLVYPGCCLLDARGSPETFFIGVSAGLDADAVHGVDMRWKKRVGRFAYLVSFLRRLQAPAEPTVEIRGGDGDGCWAQVMVLKMPFYGGPFRLGDRASLMDPALEVVAVERGRAQVLHLFWDALRGRRRVRRGQARFLTSRVTLRLPDPGLLQIDGDPFHARTVELFASPAPIRVLRGAVS